MAVSGRHEQAKSAEWLAGTAWKDYLERITLKDYLERIIFIFNQYLKLWSSENNFYDEMVESWLAGFGHTLDYGKTISSDGENTFDNDLTT